jgi:phosphoribosylaminoimidazole-succinocarboxamide synthase
VKPVPALTRVDLPLKRVASGKVREVFELSPETLLFVATDRISAYDVVMAEGIPDKGAVLNGMTLFWLDLVKDICASHLISASPAALPQELSGRAGDLEGRFMIVRKLEMLPVEFIIRGYLAGSGWGDYKRSGAICGIPLPAGLVQSDQLPEPIFTPTTKAATGHDEAISEDEAVELAGAGPVKIAKELALAVYTSAARHARSRGIILADTKFEFGVSEDGEVQLADEVLTPDSSRFWPVDEWEPGRSAPSFDKQFLRDWLDEQRWDRKPPPPSLPEDVISGTSSRYLEAYECLTGAPLQQSNVGSQT